MTWDSIRSLYIGIGDISLKSKNRGSSQTLKPGPYLSSESGMASSA